MRARTPVRLAAAALGLGLAACANLDTVVAPDTVLTLTATPQSLPANGFATATIVAEIDPRSDERFRDTGTVSRGTEVSFSATDDSTGRLFGFFSGVTPSDALGKVSADFTPGNTDERGEATLTARVRGANVRSSVKIEIVDP